MNKPLIALTSLLLVATHLSLAEENSTVEAKEREIGHILARLGQSDCQFIRNGKAYSGEKAADHLAGKYNYARDKIHSAEMFIEHIASKSYFSGRAYRVNCPGGPEQDAKNWLTAVLQDYRKMAVGD
jgi:hypothetical protein